MASLPPLAEVDDLAAWVDQAIPGSDPRAGAVLSAASMLVRAYCGDDFTGDVPDVVSQVTVQVAGRVWSAPTTGANYTQENVGSYGYSQRFPSSAGGGLYLSKTDKQMLAAYRVGGAPSSLGVIATTRGEDHRDTYLSVDDGAPIPFLPGD